jgi:hypothetical protein
MAKELGRKLGKTLVADGWHDKVWGLFGGGAFWGADMETSNYQTHQLGDARRCYPLPDHRVAVIRSFSIVRQQQ